MSSDALSPFACNVKAEYNIDPKPFDEGRFGKVFKGKRRKDGLEVAIKVLDSRMLKKSESLEWDHLSNQKDLMREINLLANLKHPFCLPLVNFSLEPEPTIITPFMPNGNLLKLVLNPDPSLSTQKMCSIYAICSTMEYLHSIGIIHRDIKPQNIFVKENNDICIADFGKSRHVGQNIYLTIDLIGSPYFVSPELIRSEPYDNKVDVYSFGVIYYQFLSMSQYFILADMTKQPNGLWPLLTAIKNGARFEKPEKASDRQFQLYIECTKDSPDLRPSFAEITQLLELDKSVWLDGVDEDVFRDYIRKCKSVNEEAKECHSNLLMPNDSPRSSRRLGRSPRKSKQTHISYDGE